MYIESAGSKALVDDIARQEGEEPFDAVVTTASGCGSVIRDVGFQLNVAGAGGCDSWKSTDLTRFGWDTRHRWWVVQ
jgi:hypothetical protein